MTKVIEKSRLTLIRRTAMGKHPKALYKCICGVEKEIIMNKVITGKTLSCGCYHKEIKYKHGLLDHPLYSIWFHIRERCYSVDSESYQGYGGDGVTMCEEWANDFLPFYKWCIANGWKKGLHVDKDIKGFSKIYSPETCVIATCKENNNAKSNSRFIEFDGETKTIAQWSEHFGIPGSILYKRLEGKTKVTDINIFRKPRHKAPNGAGKQRKRKT